MFSFHHPHTAIDRIGCDHIPVQIKGRAGETGAGPFPHVPRLIKQSVLVDTEPASFANGRICDSACKIDPIIGVIGVQN